MLEFVCVCLCWLLCFVKSLSTVSVGCVVLLVVCLTFVCLGVVAVVFVGCVVFVVVGCCS